jgi:hypothetical protein
MNNFLLKVVEKTNNNNYHCKVFVDGNESGILYLTEDQFLELSGIISRGCNDRDITYKIENNFDFVEEDFELDDQEE